jgi:hypothetical protein
MKTCTKCKATKPLELFSAQAKGKYGVTSVCKACTSELGKAWAKANPARHAANAAAWQQQNRARCKATRDAWAKRNADRERERLRAWAQNNKARSAEKVAARRAAKLRATPAWADMAHIAAFYRWAKECQAATGLKVNVDHVVPLVSDVVCGLHCPANLCILTEKANKAKGNAWDTSRTFYP